MALFSKKDRLSILREIPDRIGAMGAPWEEWGKKSAVPPFEWKSSATSGYALDREVFSELGDVPLACGVWLCCYSRCVRCAPGLWLWPLTWEVCPWSE